MLFAIIAVLVALGVMYYADRKGNYPLYEGALVFSFAVVIIQFVVMTILALI